MGDLFIFQFIFSVDVVRSLEANCDSRYIFSIQCFKNRPGKEKKEYEKILKTII